MSSFFAFPAPSTRTGHTLLAAIVAGLVSVLLMASVHVDVAAAQDDDEAQADTPVTFLQGVGDRDLDVYINGKIAMRNVSFGSFSAAMLLPQGKYRIDLRDAGSKRRSPRIARISLRIVDDRPITLVSYQRPNGKIKVAQRAVDTTWVNGESRLIVRHLASAPVITMSYDGGPVFRDIKPGRSRRAVVPALPFDIKITTDVDGVAVPVLDPVRVSLVKNTVTVVYVVGDFDAGTARAVFHAYRTPETQNG